MNWSGNLFDQMCYSCLSTSSPPLSRPVQNFVLRKQKLVFWLIMRDLYLLPYCFANTVTEHQNSVHGCFLLWLLNLGFWDGNWCFTDELSKRLVPRPTKDYLHNLTCIGAFSQTLQVAQLTRVETTNGSMSMPLFVILVTLSSTFLFKPKLFSQHIPLAATSH